MEVEVDGVPPKVVCASARPLILSLIGGHRQVCHNRAADNLAGDKSSEHGYEWYSADLVFMPPVPRAYECGADLVDLPVDCLP